MARLGEAFVVVRASLGPLKAGLAKARQMVVNTMKSIARTVKRVAKVAVAGFIAISVAAVKLAMDAEESENLFTVSMGKMAESTRVWSEEVSNALGLNAYEVRKFVSTYNVMLESMGLTTKESAAMSKSLVQLAYDMSSFYNLKPEEAFQKLQSGITGEIEPLKRLGILVNETTTKQWALNKGMIKGKEKLTEIQKVQARYNVIMEQTKKAQGDMARTVDSTTNVFRSLWSQIISVGIAYGEKLLPPLTAVAAEMRDWLKNNKEKFVEWGTVVGEKIALVVGYINELITLVKDEGWGAALAKIGADVKKAFTIVVEKVKPHAITLGKAIAEGFVKFIKDNPKIVAALGGGLALSVGSSAAVGAGVGAAGSLVGKGIGKVAGAAGGALEGLSRAERMKRGFVAAPAAKAVGAGMLGLAAVTAAVTAAVGIKFVKELKSMRSWQVGDEAKKHTEMLRKVNENLVKMRQDKMLGKQGV